MSKRPPIAGGKIALASQRKKSRQLLESEQRQRDRADLLLLVGRNSLLAASVAPGTPSGRDERYAARVASAEKARNSIDLTVIRTNSYVVEKIVYHMTPPRQKQHHLLRPLCLMPSLFAARSRPSPS